MARYAFLNNWSSTLTASSSATDGSIDVSSADANTLAEFRNTYEPLDLFLTLEDVAKTKIEIVKVSGVGSTFINVDRAQQGTTAQTWDIGDTISMRVTSEPLNNQFNLIDLILTDGTDILIDQNGNLLSL